MTIEITLTKGQVAIVDDIDGDLDAYKWSFNIRYALRDLKSEMPGMMHRHIMERMLGRKLAKHEQVDHINRNGIDNRRENLRLATAAENTHNQDKRKSASGLKGAFLHTQTKRWVAKIKVNRKPISLGSYGTPLDAHRAFCIAALKYHGDFANFGSGSPFTGWQLSDFENMPNNR